MKPPSFPLTLRHVTSDPANVAARFSGVRRIGVIKLKHIGDVLLATPCFRALRETFPEAEIHAVVNDESASVLAHHPLLAAVHVFPRRAMRAGFRARLAGERAFLRAIRTARFDMTVDLTSGDRPAWISRLSGARYRLARDPDGKGFWEKRRLYTHLAPPCRDPNLHEVLKNLGVLAHAGISTQDPRMEVFPSDEDDATAVALLRETGFSGGKAFAVAHPTSRWLWKCWPAERFAALLAWIRADRGLPVVLTCGPDPREIAWTERMLACGAGPLLDLRGKLTLLQWAALAKRARLFVGVDSAPMHLAAAQGTPTLCFFGPTGWRNWAPWGVRRVILVRECPCAHDRSPHCDWSKPRACLEAISLDDAKAAVAELLKPGNLASDFSAKGPAS
ncbi:MAG: putative lipopolysaccharide heptosyltransferase III [Verrucomicrobiae bacterium]|nr:putative lipopolysaccharide heptosyltransferase III [Verrucomicrobiae bacterium]